MMGTLMKISTLRCFHTVMLFTIALASPARAAFTVYDDFTTPASGTVDSSLWSTVTTGGVLPAQSGGIVNADSISSSAVVMRSAQLFTYGSFRFTMTSYTGSFGHAFGIDSQTDDTTFSSKNAIYLRDDGGSIIYIGGVGQNATLLSAYQPSSFPVDYTFVWNSNLIQIYRATSVIYQTTDTSLIPTGPMRFEINAYNNSKYSFDQVAYQAVPEPTSLALLGMGIFGALRGRKLLSRN
jgi:PEP-CTERM motif